MRKEVTFGGEAQPFVAMTRLRAAPEFMLIRFRILLLHCSQPNRGTLPAYALQAGFKSSLGRRASGETPRQRHCEIAA